MDTLFTDQKTCRYDSVHYDPEFLGEMDLYNGIEHDRLINAYSGQYFVLSLKTDKYSPDAYARHSYAQDHICEVI